MNDRRTGRERRSSDREEVTLDIEWESFGERQNGTLSDLSLSGCFVLSGGTVSDGDRVRLFVPFVDGMRAEVIGTVANHVPDIGFAVKFVELTAPQKEVIRRLIDGE